MKKTAVITGASRGIGRAAALLFAENGYDLALCCRHNANLLQQTANQARQLGAVCLTYTGDMGDPDSCAGFFKEIDDTFSSIDVLINNAGISITGLFQDMTQEEWQRILSSNLSSVFYMSQQAVRRMLPRHQGCIVNVSSVWGSVGAFGAIDTDMNHFLDEEEIRALCEEIPMGRMGTAQEAAVLLLQLCQGPDYLTGQIVAMDGGWI